MNLKRYFRGRIDGDDAKRLAVAAIVISLTGYQMGGGDLQKLMERITAAATAGASIYSILYLNAPPQRYEDESDLPLSPEPDHEQHS